MARQCIGKKLFSNFFILPLFRPRKHCKSPLYQLWQSENIFYFCTDPAPETVTVTDFSMSRTPIVAPSILASDFANLGRDIEMINSSEADWIHVDIMDGVFVPNLSMGLPVVEAVNRVAKKPLDVHLMIIEPERYVEAFRKAGAEVITVHLEACKHLHRNIQHIKSTGAKAGVALNPHTAPELLAEIIADVDLVLIMSVNPGFGGQKFIENTYRKISRTKEMIVKSGSKALIEIDGGVNHQNAKLLLDAGADVLVAGNFVFSSPDPVKTIAELKRI
jgi:ribulose-phosphate 3-epimerase